MYYLKIIAVTCSIVIVTACSKNNNDKNTTINSGSKTHTYYNNSKIDTTAGNTINSGNFIVFEYNYVRPDDPAIADDEVSDKIIFQIPVGQTSFSLVDNQITNAVFKRWRYCFCFFIGPYANVGGNISGIKNGNLWQISGIIKTSNNESIDISSTYTIK